MSDSSSECEMHEVHACSRSLSRSFSRSLSPSFSEGRISPVPLSKKVRRSSSYQNFSDLYDRDTQYGRGAPASGTFRRLMQVLAAALVFPVLFYSSSSALPSRYSVRDLAALIPSYSSDVITIHRDPKSRQWGMHLSDTLMLSRVDDYAPGKLQGLSKFVSRRITHANGVAVLNAEQFTMVESRVGETLTLQFAPSAFVVGAPVNIMQRVLFKSGTYIEPGTKGIVIRVPGDVEGSVASVKSTGVGVWDAMPGQVEPDIEAATMTVGTTVRTLRSMSFMSGKELAAGAVGVVTKVPGDFTGSVAEVAVNGIKFDAMPGQVAILRAAAEAEARAPLPLATEEVVQLLEALGHQQYLPRLVMFGLDRLDFLAQSAKSDGAALGIKPAHWKRIVSEARHRVPLSGRGRSGLEQLCNDLGEMLLLPKLIGYGLGRLDELAKTEPRDGQALKIKPEQWTRIVDEAKKRVNMTTSSLEQPQTPAHQALYRMMQDVGLVKHYKRLIVFGLDSIMRMAKSQNISTTIELQGWEWNRLQEEALRRLAGKSSLKMASGDPEAEKQTDMMEHEQLAQRFEEEDQARLPRGGLDEAEYGGGGNAGGLPYAHAQASIVDNVVHNAASKEDEQRKQLSAMIEKLTALDPKDSAKLFKDGR
eukprot:TRINITY_DN19117_c0_g1_i1.p1 TRINITY_DN19117_c0_g1~~TRINITY_DN19117_c0_g1_i1.p1  ORF type:complete len:646 (+),score=231.66 TRINITY_DN19117_c0_g1_i1:80-2017(+)